MKKRDRVKVDSERSSISLGLKELVDYKDLFLILAYRDFRVRYAQTYLGFVWAFMQPAITLLIFIVVFGVAAKVDTKDVPYPVFAIVGMSAWSYFSFVMMQSGNSVINAQSMIKKIYFPRLVIPLAKSLVGLVDFFIVFLMMIIVLIYYQQPISGNIYYFPFFVFMNIVSALAVGIWLSALTVRYRDFQHIIPFATQFGLYATPIAYPSDAIVGSLDPFVLIIYYLNPMAGIVEGYRLSILGLGEINFYSYISYGVVIMLFISGMIYFKKVERTMADIV
ncbi:MAG: ABC transporter permease [Bacteroidota bacterium]